MEIVPVKTEKPREKPTQTPFRAPRNSRGVIELKASAVI